MGSFQIMVEYTNKDRHTLVLKLCLGTKLGDSQQRKYLLPCTLLSHLAHVGSQRIHLTFTY